METILVNHNFSPEWLLDYPELSPLIIYDRSDDGISRDLERFGKIIETSNIGNVDYDKLSYLVDNYESLPDVFLWGKTNLFKYITKEEFDKVKHQGFTPLLTQHHKIYNDKFGVVCYYENGMYYERNDSWYLNEHAGKYIHSWDDWARKFQLPSPRYIPFAPGGNYILSKDRVHRYSRDLYHEMMKTLDYTTLPGEAQCCERSYYLLWK